MTEEIKTTRLRVLISIQMKESDVEFSVDLHETRSDFNPESNLSFLIARALDALDPIRSSPVVAGIVIAHQGKHHEMPQDIDTACDQLIESAEKISYWWGQFDGSIPVNEGEGDAS